MHLQQFREPTLQLIYLSLGVLYSPVINTYLSQCLSSLSLDPEQKDILIEVIEKLLADKTTVSTLCPANLCLIKFLIKTVPFLTLHKIYWSCY